MTAAVRVLLAEADRPTRMGLRLALQGCGFGIAAEVGDAAAAVDAAQRERPDLALVASDLPGGGISAVRAIAAGVPATRIVVLTARQSGDELVAAVLAGASGYLGKDTGRSRLPQALEGVLAGEAAVPRRYTQHILEALRSRDARRALLPGRARDRVTDRQWEVLNLLADGRSTAEIAHRLGISQVTARRHISSLLLKLGIGDRAGAVELMRGRSRE
jgi:DNA-binding NarL/FixJ family response regulator